MPRQLTYTPFVKEDSSFALVRTNPALTGNIKLTVDSTNNLWLNSIEANRELANDQYKKVPVIMSYRHSTNVSKFFDSGNTPAEIIFDIHKEVDPAKISNAYEDQYDFSLYYSGVKYLKNKFYDEEFTYFAPLYIKKRIPDYFIIIKVDDPINKRIDLLKADYPYDKTKYIFETLKKGSIIKTFDMRTGTKIGTYLRKILSDVNLPQAPLNVNFTKDAMTTWNGISVKSGSYAEKGEYLNTFFKTDNPLKYFEEYITLGYSRNSIIFPYIINLEFLFDDDTSELYDFNRYIGFYVDAIEIEQFHIDMNKMFADQTALGNTPRLRNPIDPDLDEVRPMINSGGIALKYGTDTYGTEYGEFVMSQDSIFLSYIQDKEGKFHLPNTTNPFEYGIDGKIDVIRLTDTEVDIGDFYGPSTVFLQDKGKPSFVAGNSHTYIKILKDIPHGDLIYIYHEFGTRDDGDGDKYDVITSVIGYYELPNAGNFYYYHNAIIPGSPSITYDIMYINGSSKNKDLSYVANAITGAINSMVNRQFKAYAYNDTVYIKYYSSGDNNDKVKILFKSFSTGYDSVNVYGVTGSDLINNKVLFRGGTNKGNRLILHSDYYNQIINNIDNIIVLTENGYSKIKHISNNADYINDDNWVSDATKEKSINIFANEAVLDLVKDEEPFTRNGLFTIKYIFKPRFGLLSFYTVKDFDYDFYSTKYNKFPSWELYQYFYIPADYDLMVEDTVYTVTGDAGTVEYAGHTYANGEDIIANATDKSYRILTGNPFLKYSTNQPSSPPVPGYSLPISDANGDISKFGGFSAMRDVVPAQPLDTDAYNLKDKFSTGLLRSEYDYFRENYTKDYSLVSKMLPYICKWGYKDGLDVRDNAYRLNNHSSFGINNFAPNQHDAVQNPENFTHEWYYINAAYDYMQDPDIMKKNYAYFDTALDDNKMHELLMNEDAFLNYFVYIPMYGGEEIGVPQYRYTAVSYNSDIGLAETFFRGVKIRFKDVLDYSKIGSDGKPVFKPNSRKFDGYKFTVVLRPLPESMGYDVPGDLSRNGYSGNHTLPPFKIKFIEQSDYKFIIMLIDLYIGDDKMVDPMFLTDDIQVNYTNVLDPYYFRTLYANAYVNSSPERAVIEGDYRIAFNNDKLSNLSYTFLYSVNNKKYNNKLDSYSTIKLSHVYNFVSYDSISLKQNVLLTKNSNYLNYDYNAQSELSFDTNNLIMSKFAPYDELYLNIVDGIVLDVANPLKSATSDSIKLEYSGTGKQYWWTDDYSSGSWDGTPELLIFASQTYGFRQLAGGRNYYKSIFSKLSFASIKRYINEFIPSVSNPLVEYETYSSGGYVITEKGFYAEIVDDYQIDKESAIVAVPDEVMPGQFTQVSAVGYKFSRVTLSETYPIIRYPGFYEPIFRDVLYFKSGFDFVLNPITNLFLSNVVWRMDEDFGLLKNFNHLKISDIRILSLQNDPKFRPLYELVDEITVGRADFDIFNASWDYGFHWKYLTKSDKIPVAGSLRITEDNAFMSKVLVLPNTVELETFTTTLVDPTVNLTSLNIDDYQIVYQKQDNKYTGLINLETALISYFRANNIQQKFEEYLVDNPEYLGDYTLDQYIDEYLRRNILDLYDLNSGDFYIKYDPSDSSIFQFVFLTDKERAEQGYNIIKDIEINKINKYVLKFTYNVSINKGTYLSPVIKIKLI